MKPPRTRPTFKAALDKFLERIRPATRCVFYFSGHGVGLGEKGNYYLPLDAKDQDAFIREERKKPGSARDLDSQDKENQRYAQYLTESALSEVEIEKAIKAARRRRHHHHRRRLPHADLRQPRAWCR